MRRDSKRGSLTGCEYFYGDVAAALVHRCQDRETEGVNINVLALLLRFAVMCGMAHDQVEGKPTRNEGKQPPDDQA